VVLSLFAYFFTMIMALSALAALLIGLFNNSATVTVLHYPHLQGSSIEQTSTTTNPQPPVLADAPTKNKPKKNINDSRDLSAKADTAAKRRLEIKNRRERLAHSNKPDGFASQREKPKVLARLHNHYARPSYYGNTLGYAEEIRTGPQRLFSNR